MCISWQHGAKYCFTLLNFDVEHFDLSSTYELQTLRFLSALNISPHNNWVYLLTECLLHLINSHRCISLSTMFINSNT